MDTDINIDTDNENYLVLNSVPGPIPDTLVAVLHIKPHNKHEKEILPPHFTNRKTEIQQD